MKRPGEMRGGGGGDGGGSRCTSIIYFDVCYLKTHSSKIYLLFLALGLRFNYRFINEIMS